MSFRCIWSSNQLLKMLIIKVIMLLKKVIHYHPQGWYKHKQPYDRMVGNFSPTHLDLWERGWRLNQPIASDLANHDWVAKTPLRTPENSLLVLFRELPHLGNQMPLNQPELLKDRSSFVQDLAIRISSSGYQFTSFSKLANLRRSVALSSASCSSKLIKTEDDVLGTFCLWWG